MATAARELAGILRHTNPLRALSVYEHSLLRLGEIRGNNVKARTEEVRLLVGSSYVLRSLHNVPKAEQRLDAAFHRLRELKSYPAERIDPDEEVYVAVRGRGDQYAETGRWRDARNTYQELLDRLMAAKPDTENDLSHATKISGVYDALARSLRQTGEFASASEISGRRRELWRHWNVKLPQNDFVRRQLESADAP
jgi:hypothetical protein